MSDRDTLSVGDRLYNESGRLIGRVHSIEGGDIHVIPAGEGSSEGEHARTGTRQGFGEADLVWRCGVCGEVGKIEEMPDACPDCGASIEELYYWTED